MTSPKPIVSPHFASNSSDQQLKKDGFTTKLRQAIYLPGRRVETGEIRKSMNLNDLDEETQMLLIRAVDQIHFRDSEQIVHVLDESRDILRGSLEEFKREQNECRRQLEKIFKKKQIPLERKKDNVIPLSIYLHQKRATTANDVDLHTESTPRYSDGLFSALNSNDQQHPSDRAAVIKYLRKRERRKRAEENRKNFELNDDVLERQKTEIIEKKEEMEVKLEYERQRQTDLLRNKIQEKMSKRKSQITANDIMDQASDADVVRQRLEQMYRDKIEARLSAARARSGRTSSNTNHHQSQTNDEHNLISNEKQIPMGRISLQILKEDEDQRETNVEPLTEVEV